MSSFLLQKSCFLSSCKITGDQILEKYVQNVEMHKTTGAGAELRPVRRGFDPSDLTWCHSKEQSAIFKIRDSSRSREFKYFDSKITRPALKWGAHIAHPTSRSKSGRREGR